LKEIFENESQVFKSLVRSGATRVLSAADADPEGCLKSYLNEQITIYVKVVGVIDIKDEIQRVSKRND